MFYLLSITDPLNKEKKWDLFLHQSIFPLEYLKLHLYSLQKDSEDDHYVVQNLMCSGVYLRSTLSNTLLQKVLILVLLTETGTEVYFSTMTTILSYYYYYYLLDILNHIKILKLKDHPGGCRLLLFNIGKWGNP